jgi:Na+:H+ antiporter, NhaA family
MLLLWYCVYMSGVHATIAGVVSAFFIPIRNVEKYEHVLHQPVNYLILPVFALANTTIALSMDSFQHLFSRLGLGIMLALIAGKSLGITGFVWLSVKAKICSLDGGTTYKHIFGLGLMAGIGFTMSLFFTALSFKHPENANIARLAIILGSTLSALCGLAYLNFMLKPKTKAASTKQ